MAAIKINESQRPLLIIINGSGILLGRSGLFLIPKVDTTK